MRSCREKCPDRLSPLADRNELGHESRAERIPGHRNRDCREYRTDGSGLEVLEPLYDTGAAPCTAIASMQSARVKVKTQEKALVTMKLAMQPVAEACET